MGRLLRIGGASTMIAALICVVTMAVPPVAAHADVAPAGTIGSFPTWTAEKSTATGEKFTGAASFDSAAHFPAVSYRTDSTTTKVPSGDSAFLGASTGFGQRFGSTRAQPYLYLSPAASGPSTTTVTFAGAPQAGWGFAVGDIDADFVEIIPRDANGSVLTGADLGAQDTTPGSPLLNYCNNSPKPSSCSGAGPFTDAPTWYPSGGTVGTTPYSSPLVVGNVLDTAGAYDWFLPGTDVRSLTFIYHVQSGFPIFQLWLAALATQTTIAGTVEQPDGDPIPSDTVVTLEHANGEPVRDIVGDPVTTPVAPDGSYDIQTEEASYDIAFTVPPGDAAIPTERVNADQPTVTLDPVELRATSTTTRPSATPLLARTGVDTSAPAAPGATALAAGLLLVALARRRRRATRS